MKASWRRGVGSLPRFLHTEETMEWLFPKVRSDATKNREK
jgi:hypothetical protein